MSNAEFSATFECVVFGKPTQSMRSGIEKISLAITAGDVIDEVPACKLHERHKCNAAGLWQKFEYFLACARIVKLRVQDVRVHPAAETHFVGQRWRQRPCEC